MDWTILKYSIIYTIVVESIHQPKVLKSRSLYCKFIDGKERNKCTCGGIPSSRNNGPKMNPPPRPRSPPTKPAKIPQRQQRINWFTVQLIPGSPFDSITIQPLYKHKAWYPEAPMVTGIYRWREWLWAAENQENSSKKGKTIRSATILNTPLIIYWKDAPYFGVFWECSGENSW